MTDFNSNLRRAAAENTEQREEGGHTIFDRPDSPPPYVPHQLPVNPIWAMRHKAKTTAADPAMRLSTDQYTVGPGDYCYDIDESGKLTLREKKAAKPDELRPDKKITIYDEFRPVGFCTSALSEPAKAEPAAFTDDQIAHIAQAMSDHVVMCQLRSMPTAERETIDDFVQSRDVNLKAAGLPSLPEMHNMQREKKRNTCS